MFGRSSRLPIDSMFPVDIGVTKQKTYDQFVSDWKNEMNEVIQMAQQKADKLAEQNRNQYNRKVHGNDIVIGGRVLLWNFLERGGTGKLRAHWENTIYRVVGKEDNLPVYNIKPENSKGTSTKKVHHNIIMHCNLLPSTPNINQNKNYNKISQDKSAQSDLNVTDENCDSDSESEIIILQPQFRVFQTALRGGGGGGGVNCPSPPYWRGELEIFLGGGGRISGKILLIFQGFCDAQINISYILSIS